MIKGSSAELEREPQIWSLLICVSVCVHLFVCVGAYACVSVCMSVCICVPVHVCVYMCVSECACVYVCAPAHVCICLCMCLCVSEYVCVCACVSLCVHVCACVYLSVHVCIYIICVFAHVSVCMCVCVVCTCSLQVGCRPHQFRSPDRCVRRPWWPTGARVPDVPLCPLQLFATQSGSSGRVFLIHHDWVIFPQQFLRFYCSRNCVFSSSIPSTYFIPVFLSPVLKKTGQDREGPYFLRDNF